MKRKFTVFLLCLAAALTGCGQIGSENISDKAEKPSSSASISEGILRKEVFALVSSAENSDTDYTKQYEYIEDIGDGRGYTAGIIGFTSGTGDLLDVVEHYTELKPNNELEKYIPALKKVNGTDSHNGLGEAFEKAWRAAAKTDEMIQAQNDILDEQYMFPAVEYANKDGLSPLGQYIYYDALVVHGSGDSEDCFEAIRDAALEKVQTPSDGGDEADYLNAFLDARIPIMQLEEAHSDLSRIDAQRKFLNEENFDLKLPLEWTMYGDDFSLTYDQINALK